jgi:hypothetical protein
MQTRTRKAAPQQDQMELSELTDKAIDYILSGLADEQRLTQWEKSFVESVSDQWTRSRRLSDKQKEVLGRIWDKV